MPGSDKLVVVTGATGGQGGSVVDALLQKGGFKIRAVTRSTSSASAQKLASRGVEVVAADLNDKNSLKKAFEGAFAVYGISDFFEPFFKHGPEQAERIEYAQAKNLADAAAETAGLSHYVWSTLPSAKAKSNGKWSVPHFEAKAEVDDYILRELPDLAKKTTFLWITYYTSNLGFPCYSPSLLKGTGKYVWVAPLPASAQIATIGDHRHNVGIFVAAILDNPELTQNGRYVLAETDTAAFGDVLTRWGKITGHETAYVHSTLAEYVSLFGALGEEMGGMMEFWGEYGTDAWSKKGVTPLTRHDLKIADKDLVMLEQALTQLNLDV